MTAASLKSFTLKDLARLAKRHGVSGWRSMRKEQLVRALLRAKRPAAQSPRLKRATARTKAKPTRRATTALNGRGKPMISRAASKPVPKSPRVVRRIEQAKARENGLKNLATDAKAPARDRLVLMVRGPFWLHAHWELTGRGVARAQAALGQEWHAARPVLRLMAASAGGSAAERIVREVEIHGGVRNWYLDVKQPPQTYRLEIGYLGPSGRFFSLARSNVVTTPAAAGGDASDHWTDVVENCDKIYAMSGGYSPEGGSSELQELFEERLRRPMGAPTGTRYGIGAEALVPRDRTLRFDVETEMIVHGATRPDSHVTLQGEPIKLREDGSFSVRLDLPNRRQVIPLVASSKDGVEQRTIILAVERNTKVMEPVFNESSD